MTNPRRYAGPLGKVRLLTEADVAFNEAVFAHLRAPFVDAEASAAGKGQTIGD